MKKQLAFLMVPAFAVAISSTASADLLYDNGDPDGTNGYSNILTAGLNLDRRVADDFNLGAGPGWLVDNVEMNYVWGTVGVPGTATDFLVQFFLDDVGGGPGTMVSSQVSNSFTATATGNVFFSRAEFIFSVDIAPVAIAANTNYYLSIQPNGDDNGFQLTAHVPLENGADTYVNYVDLTGGLWSSAENQFGTASDMVFRVNGEAVPAPGALALLGLAGLAGVRRRRRYSGRIGSLRAMNREPLPACGNPQAGFLFWFDTVMPASTELVARLSQ